MRHIDRNTMDVGKVRKYMVNNQHGFHSTLLNVLAQQAVVLMFAPLLPTADTNLQRSGNITQYLRGMICGARYIERPTLHTTENPWKSLNKQFGSFWFYLLILVLLDRLPSLLAQPFFQIWRLLDRLRLEWLQRIADEMKGAV